MLIPVNPDADMPLYLQVAHSLKKYLESLPTGHKLPSQRDIAAMLKVSKTTVVEAFHVLTDDGVIATREKSRAVSSLQSPGVDWPLIIHKASRSRENDDGAGVYGGLSNSLLMWPGMDFAPQTPLIEVSDAVSRRIASVDFMNYDDMGFLHLRELLAQHLKTTLGILCAPEDIVITSGISNALFIIACAFFGRFSPVLYEAPGYYDRILHRPGVPVIPLTMCEGGIAPELLQQHIARHRHAFFMTTPLQHWPTCHMTSEENKHAQYALCQQHDIPIIEVDAMRGLFDAPPPMRAYPGSSENVIYVGTLTNTIGHSMRLAWIVAPGNTVKRLLEVKAQVEPRISTLIQIYAEEILRTGAYERYLASLKVNVAQRNQDIEVMLNEYLHGKATWRGSPGVSRMITFHQPPDVAEIVGMQGRQISALPLVTLDKSLSRSVYMYCAADPLAKTETLIRRLSCLT